MGEGGKVRVRVLDCRNVAAPARLEGTEGLRQSGDEARKIRV
jgi:hypothetical protein